MVHSLHHDPALLTSADEKQHQLSLSPEKTHLCPLSPIHCLIGCLYQSISLDKHNKLEDLVDCWIIFEELQINNESFLDKLIKCRFIFFLFKLFFGPANGTWLVLRQIIGK